MSCCEVLARKADFQRIRDNGRALRGHDVVVVYVQTDRPACRYAVVASRRIGSAVCRNRAKRVLREAQRQVFRDASIVGIDILLIARTGTGAQTSQVLREQIETLLVREGMLFRGARTRPVENGDSS